MLSDDVFRSRLQATIASLRYWVPTIADCARTLERETADFWRLAVTPAVEGACAFELMLHPSQRYDLAVAGETYEDRPVESLDLFLPLVEALVEGRVVQRRKTSLATGVTHDVETIVSLAPGKEWRDHRHRADTPADTDVVFDDRHFLPYRR